MLHWSRFQEKRRRTALCVGVLFLFVTSAALENASSTELDRSIQTRICNLRGPDAMQQWKELKRASLGTKAGLPLLVAALQVGIPRIRQDAAGSMILLKGEARAALPALRDALQDIDTDVRVEAAFALWTIDKDARRALPVYLEAIRDKNYVARMNIPTYIEMMGKKAQSALPTLLELTKDTDRYLRANVISILWSYHPDARVIPALHKALKDTDSVARGNAAIGLGNVGKDACVALPDLRRLLGDRDAMVRTQAAFAVWKLDRDAKRTVPILIDVLRKQENVVATSLAVRVLGSIGTEARPALPALRKLMAELKPCPARDAIEHTLQQLEADAGASPKKKGAAKKEKHSPLPMIPD